jgi:hypothetical protein
MSTWTEDALRRIGDARELRIASQRPDGTLRAPRTIWHVRVGDAIYIRSAHGPDNGWFRRARSAGTGQISSGGIEQAVTFVLADPAVREDVDRAYHEKYDRYGPGPVGAVTGPDVLETTLLVMPRE